MAAEKYVMSEEHHSLKASSFIFKKKRLSLFIFIKKIMRTIK